MARQQLWKQGKRRVRRVNLKRWKKGVVRMKSAEEIIELLEQNGFDTQEGLEICIGDPDIYMEVLETALDEGKEKVPFIRECAQNEDYERYLIEVHGLKNAAKSIGAMELSQMAYEQEMAAKGGDHDCIRRDYQALLEKYDAVLKLLEEMFQ